MASHRLRVFVSSPSDVDVERETVARIVARLGAIYRKYVSFELVRWETKFYEATRSFQESVESMDSFDLVLGILWKRIGTELPPDRFLRSDGRPYESGTVYEIEAALAAYKAEYRTPSVYVFKKTEPIFYSAKGVEEEKRQKELLDDWWSRHFEDEKGHCLAGANRFDTIESFESILETLLIDWLKDKGHIPSGPVWDFEALGRSPYPGLIAYDRDRSIVFFGRTYAIQEAKEQLLEAASAPDCVPALFLIGASGSGKSSLARAGLIPELTTQGSTVDVAAWRVVIAEPSTDPIQALADRLYEAIPELTESAQSTSAKWAELAKASPAAATDLVRWCLSSLTKIERQRTGTKGQTRLLLLIDQLEIILGTREQSVFTKLIEHLVLDGHSWLIATIRSDRYADLQNDAHLLHLKRLGVTYDLPPPGPAEIRDIIKGPAQAAGLRFSKRDGASLADALSQAIPNADGLPLLQMTLAQLFERREGDTLTHSAYEEMGGMEGAIATHANAVLREATLSARRELPEVLRNLVKDVSRRADGTIRFTAQRIYRSNSSKKIPQRALVDLFVERRLLVSDGETIRLAHEALLRWWKPGHQALEKIADAELRRSRLRTALAGFSALVFLGIAATSILLYERSNHNLALALRARADQFIDAGMPARALLLATNVSQSVLSSLRVLFGDEGEEALRLQSIVRLASPAALKPAVLLRSKSAALAVDTSIDEQMIAVGYASGEVKVAYGDGRLLARMTNGGSIISVKLAPQLDRLFIATDSRIYVWPLGSDDLQILHTGGAELTDLTIARSSNLLAWSAKDRTTTLLDLSTGVPERFEDHKGWTLSVAFSADGKRLASIGDDSRVIVRETKSPYKVIASFNAAQKDIWSIALSPDGSRLATASVSGSVSIWQIEEGTQSPQSRGLLIPQDRRWKVSFATDGKTVAVASWGGTVMLFDPDDGQHLGTLDGNDQRVNDLVFVGRDHLITASNTGDVKRWPVAGLRPMLFEQSTGAEENVVASYSRDGRLFIAGGNDGIARVFDVGSNGNIKSRCTLSTHAWIRGVAISSDGSVALALRASGAPDSIGSQMIAFDPNRCEEGKYGNLSFNGDITAIAARPSAKQFALGTGDGRIALLDLNNGTANVTIKLPISGGVMDLDINNSGTSLVLGTDAGEVEVIDLQSHGMRQLSGPTEYVSTVKFAPNGLSVAAGGRNDKIFIWDLSRSAPTAARTLAMPGGTNYLGFSADGKQMAAGSDDLYLAMWNVDDWSKAFVLHQHVGIRSVYGFHPTRNDLAFDGGRGMIQVLPAWTGGQSMNWDYGILRGVEPIFDAGPKSNQKAASME